jgi:hypothetical protein
MNCTGCGQLTGIEEYDNQLWDVYHRIDDGRSNREALVFYADDEHHDSDDEDGRSAMVLAMERNMHERGLCVTCGRPDLRGIREDQIMSEEDARELWEMHAEQAAERRAGC